MECKEAKKQIVDFFYDELDQDKLSSLENHIAECEACSEYKQEIQSAIQCLDQQKEFQSSIDLTALHNAIERKQSHSWSLINFRMPVWGTALLVLLGILLSILALSKTEIQYTNSTLTISFGGAINKPQSEQNNDQIIQARLQAKIDDLAKRTAQSIAEQKREQLKFQAKLAKNMENSQKVVLKVIKDYESRRDTQLTNLVQQIQLQHYQSIVEIRKEYEFLALNTEKEFRRSYSTMAAMAGLLSYQGQ
jgi:hypothetical protein